MRKIYLVPNFITTGNMFCGFSSIVASVQGDFSTAAWLILAAAVFDMLDGRIARLAKATSEFGVQYDSMSDLISFGMAPGILLFKWSLEPFGRIGMLASFLYVACGALRLARFNVNTKVVPKGFFQGLPSPASAGMVATFILFSLSLGLFADSANSWLKSEHVALVLSLGMGSLMVSNIKFPSFKELNWRSRATFGYLMVGVLLMVLIAVRPEITLFIVLSAYVCLSLIWNVFQLMKGSQAEDLKTAPAGKGD